MSVRDDIRDAAERHGVDPDLAEAVALVESGLDPWAGRFEPNYKWRVHWQTGEPRIGVPATIFPAPPGVSHETEWALQMFSYGPLQLMGGNFRALGYREKFLWSALDPEVSIEYGVRFLARKIRQAGGDLHRALVLWNGSEAYPPKVMARLAALKGDE
jgi:soluble lytic murein transglycosylase-like protein